LAPFIVNFEGELLVIGGNIAKANSLFLTKLEENLKKKNINLSLCIIENTEEISIVGSSYLFNEVFWEKIKEELPYF
jgi:glucokinase